MIDLWNPPTWEIPVARVISDVVPAKVRRRLLDVPAKEMYDDTVRYLDEALAEEKCAPVQMLLPELRAGYERVFDSLRGFHACKPTSLDSYLQEGLKPLDRKWLEEEAFALFEGTIPRPDIATAAREADLDLREGKIFLEASRDVLTEFAGHYLVYGPEAMNCLWHNDEARFHESQVRQRRRGIPTIFECAVPLRMIDDDFRDPLVYTLTTLHFKRCSRIPEEEQGADEWGFSVSRPLPPTCILGHTHPAVISDPLQHGMEYESPATVCSWCSRLR